PATSSTPAPSPSTDTDYSTSPGQLTGAFCCLHGGQLGQHHPLFGTDGSHVGILKVQNKK
ncbi:MAG: hypothetical protein ACRCUF_18810, partial [Aeromonas sobria]